MDQGSVQPILLPYYYRNDSVFTEEFIYYSKKELEDQYVFPLVKEKMVQKCTNKPCIKLRCGIFPNSCAYQLKFVQQFGENNMNGYAYRSGINYHTCLSSESMQAHLLQYRKNEIRQLRQDILSFFGDKHLQRQPWSLQEIINYLTYTLQKQQHFLWKMATQSTRKEIKKYFAEYISNLKEEFDFDSQYCYEIKYSSYNSMEKSQMESNNEDYKLWMPTFKTKRVRKRGRGSHKASEEQTGQMVMKKRKYVRKCIV